ncbi:hypothetical protein EDB19DRAFT_1898645 [Suillus lakei]|nr:hypothetical protein EDB19DRAFT_1898645 [Suillus lakei]
MSHHFANLIVPPYDHQFPRFVRLLFVRQSPNQTAWCNAVETFLDGMGYKLLCKVGFSNSHACILTIMARDHISTLITDVQKDQARLPPINQPSEYLRSRCLLCFGGNTYHGSDLHSIPDAIISIDACFTQKRSTNPHGADSIDPPNPTPIAEGDEDHYEEGMHVPVSVLNGCGESFVAADEKREKASTCLMALLCRHDRVLWPANLTSAGEK